jgi:regulator of replication initiation timing
MMSDEKETVASRLWRDRVQIREQERNEALARLRIAEEKVAILLAENDRLTAENARLRTLLNPDTARDRAATEQQMQALRGALMPLLVQPTGTMNS